MSRKDDYSKGGGLRLRIAMDDEYLLDGPNRIEAKPEAPALDELLAKVRHHEMTPAETEAQRQSWVRGEMALAEDERGMTTVFPKEAPAKNKSFIEIHAYSGNRVHNSYETFAFESWDTALAIRDELSKHIVARTNRVAVAKAPAPQPEKVQYDAKFHAFMLVNRVVEKLVPLGAQLTKEQADSVHQCAKDLARDLTSGEFVFVERESQPSRSIEDIAKECAEEVVADVFPSMDSACSVRYVEQATKIILRYAKEQRL